MSKSNVTLNLQVTADRLAAGLDRMASAIMGDPKCETCDRYFPEMREFGPEVVQEFLATHAEVVHGAVV